MRKYVALLLFLISATALAQTKVNPVTQIRWPLLTGSGVPTAACSSSNYGQPYQNTAVTPNVPYICGTAGWTATGGVASITGDSTISVTPSTGAVALHVLGTQPNQAGAAFANQYNNGFTTVSSLVPASAISSGVTSFTFTSVAGFPSVGCGSWNQMTEADCWTGVSGNTLTGITTYYGSTSKTHATTDSFAGIVTSQSTSTSSVPASIQFNTGALSYGTYQYNAPFQVTNAILANGGLSSPANPIFSVESDVGVNRGGGTTYYPLVQTTSSTTDASLSFYPGGSGTQGTRTAVIDAVTGLGSFSYLYLPTSAASYCLHQLSTGQIVPTSSDCGSASSVAFSGVTGGTNTTAAMLVGSGASLATTGSGTIAATSVPASGIGGGSMGAALVVTGSLIPGPSGFVGANHINSTSVGNDAASGGLQLVSVSGANASWQSAVGGAAASGNVVMQPGAGTGATFSINGYDVDFEITFTTGTSPNTSQPIFTYTFAQPKYYVTWCSVTPTNWSQFTSLNQVPGIQSSSASSVQVMPGSTALTASQVYSLIVRC